MSSSGDVNNRRKGKADMKKMYGRSGKIPKERAKRLKNLFRLAVL